MNRRSFLKLMGKGVVASSALFGLPVPGWPETGFDYALRGQELIQKQDFSGAVAVLREAIRIDPGSDWAYGLLGRAYHGLGRPAEAVASFREAVRLNSQDTYSRMMIDMLTQRPLPRIEKKKTGLSELEAAARREEETRPTGTTGSRSEGYRIERVVVDAGHGGFDSGAVGSSGLNEKDVTLDLARKVHERFRAEGRIRSFLTRTGDYYVPLSDRTAIANQYQADLFISIHVNASKNAAAHGSETYYCSEKASSAEAAKLASFENSVLKFDAPRKEGAGYIDIEEILLRVEQKFYWNQSAQFAENFQLRFKSLLPLKSRGVHSANFFVLRRAKMPSLLIETGFISNPTDEERLKDPAVRERIVDAVVRGVV
jgi:N-acetylmuramoyl-L-alanine amidase